jgi:predicted HAD superfamily Cof-like phosphohydrolase
MILTLARRVRCYRVVRRAGRTTWLTPVIVPPGSYRAHRVPNPADPDGTSAAFTPWIVLGGREVGQSEVGWRRFLGPKGPVAITEEADVEEEAYNSEASLPAGPPRRAWEVVGRDWFEDVLAFHRKFRCAIGSTPAVPQSGTVSLRYRLLGEELEEVRAAMSRGPEGLPELADGLADLVYVALGTAISYGIDLRPVWDAIHDANLRKVGGVRDDGKVMKGRTWKHPDIGAILQLQPPLGAGGRGDAQGQAVPDAGEGA